MTPQQRLDSFRARKPTPLSLSEIERGLPYRTLSMRRDGLISYGSLDCCLDALLALYVKSARMKERDLDVFTVEVEISLKEAAASTPIYFVSITQHGRDRGVNFDVESDFNIPLDLSNTVFTA